MFDREEEKQKFPINTWFTDAVVFIICKGMISIKNKCLLDNNGFLAPS